MQVSGLPAGFEPSQNLQRGREAGVRWDGAVTVVWSAGKSRWSTEKHSQHCEALRARKDLMEQHFSVSHQQTNKQTLIEFRVIRYNCYVSLLMEYPEALTSQGRLGSNTLLKRESVRVGIVEMFQLLSDPQDSLALVSHRLHVSKRSFTVLFFFHKPYSSMLRSQKSQFAMALLIYFTDYSKYTSICYEMCFVFLKSGHSLFHVTI